MCLLPGEVVAGGASVGSRVSRCQVAKQQHQRVGEIPRSGLVNNRSREAGFPRVLHWLPWQRRVKVFVCQTGEVEVSALSSLLLLLYTESSWDIWREKTPQETKRWIRGKMEFFKDLLMEMLSQFLCSQITKTAWNQENQFQKSSIFLTLDDNLEWLLWAKAVSGIQWKAFIFTLAIWNFPWKWLESFLMVDSVYLSRTPQGLPK